MKFRKTEMKKINAIKFKVIPRQSILNKVQSKEQSVILNNKMFLRLSQKEADEGFSGV